MKKTVKTFVLFLAAALLASLWTAGVSFAGEEDPGYLADVRYMEGGKDNHLCDIYGVDGTVKPVILEVHGGGYVGGSKETNSAHSAYWAENGFICVNINYTVMPKGDMKSEMQEFYAALNFIADNAETYGFDLNNVFISGDSAGGGHVEMIAANYVNPELAALNEITVPENLVMRGVVITCSGIVSFDQTAEAFRNGEASGPMKGLGKILSDDSLTSLYVLKDWMVADKYPPCILIGTPSDVLAGTSILELDEYLTEMNIEHELVYLEDDENQLVHVFNVSNPEWKESIIANGAAVEFMKAHMQ